MGKRRMEELRRRRLEFKRAMVEGCKCWAVFFLTLEVLTTLAALALLPVGFPLCYLRLDTGGPHFTQPCPDCPDTAPHLHQLPAVNSTRLSKRQVPPANFSDSQAAAPSLASAAEASPEQLFREPAKECSYRATVSGFTGLYSGEDGSWDFVDFEGESTTIYWWQLGSVLWPAVSLVLFLLWGLCVAGGEKDKDWARGLHAHCCMRAFLLVNAGLGMLMMPSLGPAPAPGAGRRVVEGWRWPQLRYATPASWRAAGWILLVNFAVLIHLEYFCWACLVKAQSKLHKAQEPRRPSDASQDSEALGADGQRGFRNLIIATGVTVETPKDAPPTATAAPAKAAPALRALAQTPKAPTSAPPPSVTFKDPSPKSAKSKPSEEEKTKSPLRSPKWAGRAEAEEEGASTSETDVGSTRTTTRTTTRSFLPYPDPSRPSRPSFPRH